jgi:hypothetical protein
VIPSESRGRAKGDKQRGRRGFKVGEGVSGVLDSNTFNAERAGASGARHGW